MSGLRLRPLNIRVRHSTETENDEGKGSCELNDFEEHYIEHYDEGEEMCKHIIYDESMKRKAQEGKEVVFDPTLLEGFINDQKQTV